MTFKTLEKDGKFYKNYFKLVGFSTKIRNTNRKGDEIKNQLFRGEVEIQDISNSVDEPLSRHKLSSQDLHVRNYITREVRNVSEQDNAKEFWKYFLRIKEKNQNLFFELNLEGDHSIVNAFWADERSRLHSSILDTSFQYNTNRTIDMCMPTTIH
ncbi:hypothetical protein Ahy_B06g083604 [Arachis hypogaea]|uniref:Protein FAR1-RELATED SEQUENCE n=1 Tax=Arachis hypogaea TaxID=3818 RepID=A0A444YQ80_ARAHY|nr:hypothetical protein Ahy_B06g083604 [Arachis hypogaea]